MNETKDKPVEVIYEGRRKHKLSILSLCRRLEKVEIEKPKPGEMESILYPKRAA